MFTFSTRTKALNDPHRVPVLDYWRAIAILAVVIFHVGYLPYGYLGVDLFFVLSGYLVSRTLFQGDVRFLEVMNFVISRAFKIWPSYYFFLFFGNLLVLYIYRDSAIDHSIRGDQWWKFIFFYQNYRGTNHHIFDQVWSLCIEEHFYILLPLGFFLWTRYFRRYPIILFLVLAILGGNLLRVASWLINFETHSATHNRIDALTWGVLLCALERTPYFKSINRPFVFFLGLIAASLAAFVHARFGFVFFEKVIFHGIMPMFFFLMLAGSINFQWRKLNWLRIISYYSFNWYLWHQIFYYRKDEPYGVALYFIVGFSLAFLATHLVEESGLKLREMWRKSLKKPA